MVRFGIDRNHAKAKVLGGNRGLFEISEVDFGIRNSSLELHNFCELSQCAKHLGPSGGTKDPLSCI